MRKNQENFAKAVDHCQALIDTELENKRLEIDHRNQQLEELDAKYKKLEQESQENFERALKTRRLDLEQDMRSRSYEKAVKILAEREEVPVESAKLAALQRDLAAAQADHKSEVESAVRLAREQAERQLKTLQETNTLTNQAKVAKVQAQLEQKEEQIRVLASTIADLKEEVKAAREMVVKVAESQRAPAVYHSGNTGNNR